MYWHGISTFFDVFRKRNMDKITSVFGLKTTEKYLTCSFFYDKLTKRHPERCPSGLRNWS